MKTYCAIIDFQKAFDNVWREGLWFKLMSINVSGKFLNVIKNMYEEIKSYISFNGQQSAFFACKNKSVVSSILSAKFVSNFDVKDYCVLFLDAHTPLEMSLNAVCEEMSAKDNPKVLKLRLGRKQKSSYILKI